jgi:ubiquinone/menaquinone biosynthesis C-methylase UbiE
MASGMQRKTNQEIRALYDGMASKWGWISLADSVLGMNRLRSKQFRDAAGHVLDVACGTGENFKFLPKADSITAIDLSPAMVVRARKRAEKMGVDVLVEEADAAALPFDDDVFDVVITAYSSCTFVDHVAAFREMQRVTRPGGQILFVEHGRSNVGWIADRQDRKIEDHYAHSGCRNNREPVEEIEEAGLVPLSVRRSHFGMGTRVRIRVK